MFKGYRIMKYVFMFVSIFAFRFMGDEFEQAVKVVYELTLEIDY